MTPVRARRLGLLIAPLLLALAGCSGAGRSSVAVERPEVETYVALGDSFTAAPYVPSTSLADGCFRSDGNYPQLVAAELGGEADRRQLQRRRHLRRDRGPGGGRGPRDRARRSSTR